MSLNYLVALQGVDYQAWFDSTNDKVVVEQRPCTLQIDQLLEPGKLSNRSSVYSKNLLGRHDDHLSLVDPDKEPWLYFVLCWNGG